MKERPILFSGDMVRAILEGRKTQTRRIVKPQPACMSGGNWYPSDVPGDRRNRTGKHYASEEHMCRGLPIDFSPYGQPGDRLWVRESFQILSSTVKIFDEVECHDIEEADSIPKAKPFSGTIIYRADDADDAQRWFPSIHMPRWASRILLEVTAIRVERLQEISVADCEAEGIDYRAVCHERVTAFPQDYQRTFRTLWDSLNAKGKRGFPWASNPWVWVVKFRRVS